MRTLKIRTNSIRLENAIHHLYRKRTLFCRSLPYEMGAISHRLRLVRQPNVASNTRNSFFFFLFNEKYHQFCATMEGI